jgi:hypothetical protein
MAYCVLTWMNLFCCTAWMHNSTADNKWVNSLLFHCTASVLYVDNTVAGVQCGASHSMIMSGLPLPNCSAHCSADNKSFSILECRLLSIKLWLIWLWVFPSGDRCPCKFINVMMWEHCTFDTQQCHVKWLCCGFGSEMDLWNTISSSQQQLKIHLLLAHFIPLASCFHSAPSQQTLRLGLACSLHTLTEATCHFQ